tara:strand:+ start:57 stop:239 length:183 start_codon:yes stop_codon:yes gene_type:complete
MLLINQNEVIVNKEIKDIIEEIEVIIESHYLNLRDVNDPYADEFYERWMKIKIVEDKGNE